MDSCEKLVDAHFRHRGFIDVVYEPDGNIPPDFLVNGNIAIEVRRLNQNDFTGTEAKGLEVVEIPLWMKVKSLLSRMGPPIHAESWFIHFSFRRPVENWKTLEIKLRNALTGFVASPGKGRHILARGSNFELEVLCRTPKPRGDMFVLAGCADEDSGGWLLAQMELNIIYCIGKKEQSISTVRSKYSEWWLVLVDYIGHGLDDVDKEIFKTQVSISHTWDKILVIDPREHSRWFEI